MEVADVFDFKVVDDGDRSFQSVVKYDDKINERYSYDSKVPNHKNINVGTNIIIRNKEFILGTAVVEAVIIAEGKKDIKYCPECDTYNMEARKVKRPLFRCENGHEFDEPSVNPIVVTKYTAKYADEFVSLQEKKISVDVLKEYYIKYNPTNSINRLDKSVLKRLEISPKMLISQSVRLKPDDAESEKDINLNEYKNSGLDERENVVRQIKARRGQKKFRNDLRLRYGDRCLITGCEVLDILEAAHINPYRGNNDNHPKNGLLLRSDIHTLFDLDLLGIEPSTLKVHINERIKKEYSHIHLKTLFVGGKLPDKAALKSRWNEFVLKNS